MAKTIPIRRPDSTVDSAYWAAASAVTSTANAPEAGELSPRRADTPEKPSKPARDDEPLTHLQRELFGIGRALCGAPAVTTPGRVHISIDVAFADPAVLQNRRLCAHCVTRFHRIRNM
jgi:hypothetical protein